MSRHTKRWLAGVLIATSISATKGYAAPPLIHFQGVLTDTAGQAVDDGVYALKFRIYEDSVGGTIVWESTGFVPLQVTNGLFNHLLGSSNTLPDSVFRNDNLWVGVSVDLDAEMSPRTRLASVPYSLRANRADTALVSLNNLATASHMMRIEDASTAQVVLGSNSAAVMKTITIPPSVVTDFMRITFVSNATESPADLRLYVNGQPLWTYPTDFPNLNMYIATLARLAGMQWLSRVELTDLPGGGGLTYEVGQAITLDTSSGITVTIGAETYQIGAPSTITVGAFIVEYDAD